MLRCSKIHGLYDCEALKKQLAVGADPNSVCLQGITPLHWSRNACTTEALVHAGAKVNAWDSQRNTPLHLAPDAKSVAILIRHGAFVNAKNAHNKTPLDMAKNDQVRFALERFGAKSSQSEVVVASPMKAVHDVVTDLSHGSVIWVFLLAFIFLARVKRRILVASGKLFLLALGFIVLNPFSLFFAIMLKLLLQEFGYLCQWLPAIVTHGYVLPLIVFFGYHYFWLTQSAYGCHSHEASCDAVIRYGVKQTGYLLTLPGYVFYFWLRSMPAHHGSGDFFVFFGIPYLLLTSVLGYFIGRIIVRKARFGFV